MAHAVAYSKTGTKKDTPVKLSVKVFDVEANHELLGLAYRVYMAAGRTAGAEVLTRGGVRGGGKKPWKQKGTGRARAGGTRLPHWTGGGVAFGPTGLENHTRTLPVKAKRAAIRQALSAQAADKKIIALEAFDGGDGKVKPVAELLTKLGLDGRVVLVVADRTPMIDRATRNLPQVEVVAATYLNVALILNADWLVMTADAQTAVTDWLETNA
jgi:large subunit ribosomal protein L4